ncbi:L,D-transpeptidase family protein [Streptomyces sp. G-G2]|uniref:L,D-transpeptidase family protein n=1 Tax=Streptomyces sp. G-G2 TaxID=3046201 RepID=UPI0024B95399|nr:L,D-transpeptidase family protein [Streptomyces sp. G-G2]MDJ0382857.1 L,D-transpeptidase family protein [Streptomyces sp. G-G2]
MIRTLGVATAVVLGATATACGPQKAAPKGPGASAPASLPASSPAQDNKPGDASPSPSASASASAPTSPSPSPTASASASPQVKYLMAEGSEDDQVRELQARLKQLGLFGATPTGFYGSKTIAAVKAFQTKHQLTASGSVDDATWKKVRSLSKKPTTEELSPTTNQVDAPDPRCMTGRAMCISKESRTLAWMIDGKVVSTMDVRFGSENTPTREGEFKVEWKAKEWTSTIYHTAMPYSMFFSEGQAVHYSSDFAARGYAGASHGCVNVRDKAKLSALFDQVKVGDKVVVYW